MKVFKPYGKLDIHDIGAIFDSSKYIGTGLLSKSPSHTSISLNARDFKFASMCFQYIYCQNSENKIAIIPMPQAKELFKKGRNHGEFVVIEWYELENPTETFELPFDE